MNKVYLVVGSTGEYSDHTQWNVTAYLDRAQAEIHVQRLKEALTRLKVDDDSYRTRHDEGNEYYKRLGEAEKELAQTLDPCAEVYYTGVSYSVQEVELMDHFDQFQETHNKKLISEA